MMSERGRRQHGTIYVTSHVCYGCAKLIANSGLSRVVVFSDQAAKHRNPKASYDFLTECGITVEIVNNMVMMVREHTKGTKWED